MPDFQKFPVLCTCGAKIGETTSPGGVMKPYACPKCQAKKKNPK